MMLSMLSASVLTISGCSSHEATPGTEEPLDPAAQQEKMTIEQAEKIIDERNKEIVIDISKLARVMAILTKQMEDLKKEGANNSALYERIAALSKEVEGLKKKLNGLEKVKASYLEDSKTLEEKVSRLERLGQEYVEEKNAKSVAEKAEAEFVEKVGAVKINVYKANMRTAPVINKATQKTIASRDEVYDYVAKSDEWYRLANGMYVHRNTVCEECIGGRDVSSTESSPAPMDSQGKDGLAEAKDVLKGILGRQTSQQTPEPPAEGKAVLVPTLSAAEIEQAMQDKGN
jgi:regulator of replication initiation timing